MSVDELMLKIQDTVATGDFQQLKMDRVLLLRIVDVLFQAARKVKEKRGHPDNLSDLTKALETQLEVLYKLRYYKEFSMRFCEYLELIGWQSKPYKPTYDAQQSLFSLN